MEEIFNKLKKGAQSLYSYATKPTVKRKASITYQVVWNYVLIFIIVTIIGIFFAGGVGAGYFASIVKDEPVRSEKQLKNSLLNYEETSEIYFSDNVYLGKLRTDLERQEVKLENVSEHVKKALIATEDAYFYKHDGVVPKALMRAVFQEVTGSAVQTGGSTLTQQLIKQQILTNEVSFDRKAKEILLAMRLEKFLEKDEILESYLNISPFGRNSSGRNISGVQTAAQGIFGVNAKDLSLPQAAFIAGLPQNPYSYTPFTQYGEVKEDISPGLNRMKTVLKRMYNNGDITKKEYDEALKYDVKAHLAKRQPSSTERYPYLTYEVEKRAIEIMMPILAKKDGYKAKDLKEDDDLYQQYYNLADQTIRQNGYKIHTTIDKKMYDNMQKVTKNFSYYQGTRPAEKTDPETGETVIVNEPIDTGAILIENSTGKILSFVGGRDFEREQLNHATAAVRSNGSTMKPLLVYAPAIEYGVSYPAKTLINAPININGYKPGNYAGGGITGLTTAREALKRSYNIPAVLQYKEILNRRPAEYLKKMGFSSLIEADYTNLSTSLGALERGVTVEENTNAFATFANGGEFVDAYMIEKIEDNDGNIIFEHKSKAKKVFSPQTAYLTLDMMRDVLKSGTAAGINNKLKFYSDWAGKTGTSQSFRDAWFVATNPNVTFGVWMGYDSNGSVETGGMSYSQRNQSLWAQLINSAYDVNPKLIAPSSQHQMPGGIVKRSYCMLTGTLASAACSNAQLTVSDYFNASHLPKGGCNMPTSSESYVFINGKKYLAHKGTPSEFTEKGIAVSSDFFNSIGGQYVIDKSSIMPKGDSFKNLVVGGATLNDNGKAPGAPAVTANGKSLSWSTTGENDVIGYYVYQNGKKVAAIKADDSRSFTSSGTGSYYVVAVDIAGNVSKPSNKIEFKTEKKADEKKEDSKKEDSKKEEKEDNKKKEENKPNAKPKPAEQTNDDEAADKPADDKPADDKPADDKPAEADEPAEAAEPASAEPKEDEAA